MIEWLRRFCFGDDVFISYSREDGFEYAPALAARLKGFKCFLDQLGSEPDAKIPERLRQKIRRSTIFVLVATPRAAQSAAIKEELQEFATTGRPIIPIAVGVPLRSAVWASAIEGLAVSAETTEGGIPREPSDNVLDRVRNSFTYIRRSDALLLSLVGGILVTTVIISGAFIWSWQVTETASTERDEASKAAATERRSAQEATNLAAAAKNDADIARRSADERLLDLAFEQGRLELLRKNYKTSLRHLSIVLPHRASDESLRFLTMCAIMGPIRSFEHGGTIKGPSRDLHLFAGYADSAEFDDDSATVRLTGTAGWGRWDVLSGRLLQSGSNRESSKRKNTVSPDSAQSASMESGVPQPNSKVAAAPLAQDPQGRYVLAKGAKNEAVLRDARTNRVLHKFRLDAALQNAIFSPDGQRVLLQADNGPACLYNIDEGVPDEIGAGFEGYKFVFTPDGERILGAVRSNSDSPITQGPVSVCVWTADKGELVEIVEDVGEPIAISPDSRWVVSQDPPPFGSTRVAFGLAKLWNLSRNGRIHRTFRSDPFFASAGFNQEGSRIVIHSSTRFLVRRNPTVVKERTASTLVHRQIPPIFQPLGPTRIWDVETGSLLFGEPAEADKPTHEVTATALTHSGQLLATLTQGSVEVWDISTGSCSLWRDNLPNSVGSAVSFDSTGTILALSVDDKSNAGSIPAVGIDNEHNLSSREGSLIQVRDAQTGWLRCSFATDHLIELLYFSTQSTLLAIGDFQITAWNPKDGSLRFQMEGAVAGLRAYPKRLCYSMGCEAKISGESLMNFGCA